ncbi:AraC family transcriptional regulator [Nocardia puris]|uniref:AraC family transcriptional regulator n=1 Tax=Nocardia puris TaxID=208602 RepID=UPI002E1BD6E0
MKRSTVEAHEQGVRHAAAKIASSLDDALDIEMLARDAGLSASRFHRVFHATLTESVAALYRRLRLERAAVELSVTELAVTTVAFRAGYTTHESFTRAFQRAYHLSPVRFRQRMLLHQARTGPSADLPHRLPAANSIHVDVLSIVPNSPAISPVPLRGGDVMPVVLTRRDSIRLAALAHTGPVNMVGEAFAALAKIAGPAGLFARPGAYGVAVFPTSADRHTDEEPTGYAAVIVTDASPVPDGLVELELPDGDYATLTHHGPYATLPDSWRRIGLDADADPDLTLDAARPSFEVYRVADHAEPSAMETDIFLPVTVMTLSSRDRA